MLFLKIYVKNLLKLFIFFAFLALFYLLFGRRGGIFICKCYRSHYPGKNAGQQGEVKDGSLHDAAEDNRNEWLRQV